MSVVIPTFQRPEPLKRAIRSVLEQDSAVLEILVVDDGSWPEVEALCESMGSSIRYIAQNRGGVSAARNAGIKASQGTVVAFLDDDDEWMPNKLATQLAILERHADVDWCCSDSVNIRPDQSPLPDDQQGFATSFPMFRDLHVHADEFFARTLTRDHVTLSGIRYEYFRGDCYTALFSGNFVYPSSAIVRRSALEVVGYFDAAFRFAEETEFFHRLSARCNGAVILSPLIRYTRTDTGSLTSGVNTTKLIRAAIESGNRALRAREHASSFTVDAFSAGQRVLNMRLAYAELADNRGPEARDALRDWRRVGGKVSVSMVAYLLLSFAPASLLNVVRLLRRKISG